MNRKYILCIWAFFILSLYAYSQSYSRKTNLPHLYINTFNGANITSKDVYVYCKLVYVDENDVVTQYDSVSIRGRGNSTWGLSKKPYKIKFKEKKRFLGKDYANAKNWTILANAGDKTLIRNALTSELANWMGMRFAPAAKFVDLTLNGVYQGNYQISDQVDVKNKRVNIVEQDYPLTANSNITGGYLLEVDGFKDGNWFSSSKSVAIRIHYPDEDEIVAAQNNYIRNYVNSFEKVLFSSDYKDPVKGYRQFVDSTSMASLYLVTEITANIDGFWSMYFYKNQNDSLFYFGPPWDYDIAYNNDYRIQPTQSKLMVDEGYGDAKTWFRQMWNDQEWFAKLINRRFEELIDNGIEQFLYHKIDSLTSLIEESMTLNYKKWSISSRMYHEIIVHSSYEDYIDDLKSFIHNHLIYLQTAFANRMPEEPTPPFQPKPFYYNISNAGTNTLIDIYSSDDIYDENNLPPSGSPVCSWSYADNRMTQYWKFEPVGDYFIITNQLGLALNDPTEGVSTATTNTGTQLNAVEPNPEDERQLWIITPQGTHGYYNLTNVYTQHTANLNGGSSANGTSILSYTTDARNASSMNRLWYIRKTDIRTSDEPEPGPAFRWELAQGWNWGASIMKQPLELELFRNDVERIVTQNAETYNDTETGFKGNLRAVNAGTLYKFLMINDESYEFDGDLCDNSMPIPIKPGWNWIGYTSSRTMTPQDALSYPFVEENDIIMGQNGFDVFYNGEWNGTLTELVPGNGYMYFSSSTKSIRFNKPKSDDLKRIPAHLQSNTDDTRVDKHAFPNVMGVIAVLQAQNDHSSLSGDVNKLHEYSIQIVDDQGICRGVGGCANGRFLLTIYGVGGELLTLHAIDNTTNQCYSISEKVIFEPDVTGTMDEPVLLTINELEDQFTTSVDSNNLNVHNIDKQIIGCYSISGLYITNNPQKLSKGIYVIRYTDGTSKKIIVKSYTSTP